MSIVKQVHLYYQSGNSDKVYDVSLEETNGGYVVNFAYGRRGSALKAGTKTAKGPVDLQKATSIYNKIVNEKTGEGYQVGKNGAAVVAAPVDTTIMAEWIPQLANAVTDDTQLQDLLNSPDWVMQEKFDGENRPLGLSPSMEAFGTNRQGKPVALRQEFVDALEELGCKVGRVVMATEDMGEFAMVHDLRLLGSSCQRMSTAVRLDMLKEEVAPSFNTNILRLAPNYYTAEEKRDVFAYLKDNGGEGVIFKHLDASYIPGRPNSGGDCLKYKFWADASFIVMAVNDKSSVAVGLLDADGNMVPMGNVTIPVNHHIPVVGDIVDVKYLYAYKDGSIYQPVYKGVRTDILALDCTMRQLKFKREA